MAVAQGWHYVAAPLAESNCSSAEWKFSESAACASRVDVGRLCAVLGTYGGWLRGAARGAAPAGALRPAVDLEAAASAVCARYSTKWAV